MHDIGFVILNYNSFDDTKRLLNQLIAFKIDNLKIVVVDNNSSKDGIEEIITEFSPIRNIHFIKNTDNSGYGAGNNIGIEYLSQKGLRYIIISNPDVRISSADTIKSILDSILQYKAAVVAPQIYNLNSELLNHNQRSRPSSKEIRKFRLKHQYYTRYIYYFLLIILIIIKGGNWKRVPKKIKHDKNISLSEVYRVHGSFFMLDLNYFIKNNLYPIFDKNIFLFYEEYVIAEKVRKYNGKILVLDAISIIHEEDSSQEKGLLPRIKYEITASKSLGYVTRNYFN